MWEPAHCVLAAERRVPERSPRGSLALGAEDESSTTPQQPQLRCRRRRTPLAQMPAEPTQYPPPAVQVGDGAERHSAQGWQIASRVLKEWRAGGNRWGTDSHLVHEGGHDHCRLDRNVHIDRASLTPTQSGEHITVRMKNMQRAEDRESSPVNDPSRQLEYFITILAIIRGKRNGASYMCKQLD